MMNRAFRNRHLALPKLTIVACFLLCCVLPSTPGMAQEQRDVDWLNWVVVNTQPATLAHGEALSDREKLEFIEDFDPDMFDWWSGALMNRACIATMRGIAADSSIEYEYEAPLHGVKYFAKEIYGNNGPGVREDGRSPVDGYGDIQMTHLSPKWHETVKAGLMRLSLYGDMVCQDNLIHGLHYSYGQFDDWSNRRFVSYMTERFSPAELDRMGFGAESFHIRPYLREQRKRLTNRMLLEDPIIHEYIRFYYKALIDTVARLADTVKETSTLLKPNTTAFYGNLGSMTMSRTPGLAFSEHVDMVWIERTQGDQPCFDDGVQARSSLMYKIGRSAGHFEKPVCSILEGPPVRAATRVRDAVMAAEAYANGGLTVLASHFKKKGGRDGGLYKAHMHHARFANAHRELFIDRQGVADVAIVNSVPSLFWRWFSSLEVERPHLTHMEAAARLLEDHHVPYKIVMFGHPDIYNDSDHLERLREYRTIVLPNVDCISDRQVNALNQWVRDGGRLVLWGEVGTRDEELHVRSRNAFKHLIADPGKGTIVTTGTLGPLTHPRTGITQEVTEAYIEKNKEAEARLAAAFVQPDPLLETDLPPTVWANVWRHGAGPMLTVQMVNYNIDTTTDSVDAVSNFTVRVRIPDGATFNQATYYRTDYLADDVKTLPRAQVLPLRIKDGYAEVSVPNLGIFGVLSLTVNHEQIARSTAAQVRKWYQRLRIAVRTPGRGNDNAYAALLRDAEVYLSRIQGHVKVDDFGALVESGRRLAEELTMAVKTITTQTPQQRDERLARTVAADALRKFDFGGPDAPEGWAVVGPDTGYTSRQGYGWVSSGPLAVVGMGATEASGRTPVYAELDTMHGDCIRSRNPTEYMQPGKNRFYPVVLPPANEAVFRVDLPNGEYVVTAVIGSPDESYNAYRVGITYIDAEGLPCVYGERLNSGRYQNRTFPVSVTDGHLDLRLWGRNVGPLYQNNCDWMINGLLIQQAGQPLTPQGARSLARTRQQSATALRDWRVLGPFEDPDWLGFEKHFGPEGAVDPAVTYKTNSGKVLAWRRIGQLQGHAPYVSFNNMLAGTAKKGACAFAMAEVLCKKDNDAFLSVSTSQFGEVYLNGSKVLADNLPAGLLGHEYWVPIKLGKGINIIVIKTLNHWGDEWAVRASLTDSDGKLGLWGSSEKE